MQQQFIYPITPNGLQHPNGFVPNRQPPTQQLQFQQKTPNMSGGFHPQLHRTDRTMYKSTIQPTSTPIHSSEAFGLGRLEAMGRFIKEDVGGLNNKQTQNNSVFSNKKPFPLTFRAERPERPKMASSVIFFNKSRDQFDQFPLLNGGSKKEESGGLSGLQSLMSKARNVQEEEVSQPTTEQRQKEGMNGQVIKTSEDANSHYSILNLTFQAQNNTKNYEFHRSPNAKNVIDHTNRPKEGALDTTLNSKVVESTSFRQSVNHTIPAKQELSEKSQLSNTTTHTRVVEGMSGNNHETGMFKKKNNYFSSTENEKTDENLLKILGIPFKPSHPAQQVLSVKSVQNTLPKTKQILKTTETISSVQSISPKPKQIIKPTEVKNVQVRPQNMSQEKATSAQRKFKKDDFSVGKKMGKGQFGQVMLVQHKLTGFMCGMKVMSKKQIKSQRYQNQIARQLSIQFYLSHRYIAPLYGYFQDEENVYLLVEFCTDGQLLEMLRKTRRMEEAEVSPIIREICEGLDYVHKEEIIHRDVKPENILFSYGTVKISDFGWAVHSGNGMRKTVSGSPLYYSPEIVMETSYDYKIDLWSIGMMTYECLLGKIPFRIYSELDLNKIVQDEIKFPEYVDVSDQAKDFILKIMKKKPEQRMEMREILRHPFITKYGRQRKVGGEVMEQFRKVLNF